MPVPAHDGTHALPLLRNVAPETAARFLHLHRATLTAAGLDGDDDDLLARPITSLPIPIARDLERVEDLANESGIGTIFAVARERAVVLDDRGEPGAVALALQVFLDHRDVFDHAHGRRVADAVRGFAEFPGRSRRAPAVMSLDALIALEAELGACFQARGRSRHCRISVIPDDGRMVFAISRGAITRVDGALAEPLPVRDCDGKPSTYLTERHVHYRPHRQDVVVFEARTGRLRIHAPDAPTVEAYRAGFGGLLFGDASWFGCGPVVSLEPLVALGPRSLVVTPGLRDVSLARVVVVYRDRTAGGVALHASDLWSFLGERLASPLGVGDVVEATLKVRSTSHPRGRRLTLKVPNRVIWGRVDDSTVRSFLEERGFLAGPSVEAGHGG